MPPLKAKWISISLIWKKTKDAKTKTHRCTPVVGFAGPPGSTVARPVILKYSGTWETLNKCASFDIDDFIWDFSISTINNCALISSYYFDFYQMTDTCLKRSTSLTPLPASGKNLLYDNSNRLYFGASNFSLYQHNGTSWVQWSAVVPEEISGTGSLIILFDENNTCYVMRTSGGDAYPRVWKTTTVSTWSPVGSEPLCSFTTPVIDLVYSEDKHLYAAYSFNPGSAGLYIYRLNLLNSKWEQYPSSAGNAPMTDYSNSCFLQCHNGACFVIYQNTSGKIETWRYQPQ